MQRSTTENEELSNSLSATDGHSSEHIYDVRVSEKCSLLRNAVLSEGYETPDSIGRYCVRGLGAGVQNKIKTNLWEVEKNSSWENWLPPELYHHYTDRLDKHERYVVIKYPHSRDIYRGPI